MDYAQLILPYKSLNMSPFELNYGYAPSTSYDWDRLQGLVTVYEEVNIADARALATRIYNT
jgi:hypothetical protein